MVIIPLTALFALMLLSCDILQLKKQTYYPGPLGENSFYAQKMTNNLYYVLEAEKLYEGEKCVIWAEKGSGVPVSQARAIANEYDGKDKIRQKIVDRFSEKDFTITEKGVEYSFENMLSYANWVANGDDGDGKLTILLLDIIDGCKNQETDPYVAGYFWGGNFFSEGGIGGGQWSNGRDMIYIDTYPVKRNPSEAYTTIAHELQHLISYVTSRIYRGGSPLDVWIDEGLSSQAEYFYMGEIKRHCVWFSNDREKTIEKGNNFFVWDNHSKESSSAIMDDYATVYLFFRWLYLQADMGLRSSIFYDIISSSNSDHQAVTAVAGRINSSWNNWEDLLRNWLAANYYPKNSYGYNDSYLRETIKVKPIAGSSTPLYPGEGVYSIINNFYSVANKDNIRYAGLAANAPAINVSSPYIDDVLLTFNANTSNTIKTPHETGSLTGVSPPPPVPRTAAEDTQTQKFNGPYVIDARDMLNRNKR